MKISFSRSSILAALAIAIVLAALPGWVRRFLQTGDPYLFTRHFFQDILARLSGPGRIRFILQPALAVVAGIRDGKRDARAGCPPFLSAMLTRRVHKPSLIVSALVSVRDLIALAIILDVIAQFLIFREVHPGAALLVGPVLIAVPYTLSRSLTNRAVRRPSKQTPIGHPG